MFKFLDPTGCTYYEGQAFQYNLPGRSERWAVTMHPDPAEPDGRACGTGRLHLMRHLDARYAPWDWWSWWAKPAGAIMGSDEEKVAAQGVMLRRIAPKVLWRALRPPFNWGARADLRGADLRRAYLPRAILAEANLAWANLAWANLAEADLRGANLAWANLAEADLAGADFEGAGLERAYYDARTLWPTGFDPQEHGAVCVETT